MVRSPTGNELEGRTTAGSATTNWDRSFGGSLDLEGDKLVVGSTGTDHSGLVNAGAAYVFTELGGTWTEQQRLIASDATEGDAFGEVAIEGDMILAGAMLADIYGVENVGSVYLFSESGGVWVEQQKLVPELGEVGARLGQSVALAAEVALAGSPSADVDLLAEAGAVCSYDWAGQIFRDGFASGDTDAWD